MIEKYLPLTYPQQNIYAREITTPNTDVNNLYFVLNIDEEINISVMEKALNLFILQNEQVRTRIADQDGIPMQYIEPYSKFDVEVLDFSDKSDDERYKIYRTWGQEYFGFYDVRLFDFKIIKNGNEKFGLYTKFHHIWCDGYATGLVWSRILTNYTMLCNGKSPEAVNYKTDVFLETDGFTDADKMFWDKYLSDLSLSDDYINKDDKLDKSANRLVFDFDKELSAKINEFCTQNNIRPYIFFAAAMSIYSHRCSAGNDMAIGILRLNRVNEKQLNTVGMSVVEAPVRVRPQQHETFLELCHDITENAISTSKHKAYPFSNIASDVAKDQRIERDILDFTISYQKTKIETGERKIPVKMWFGNPSVMSDNLIMHILDLFNDAYTVFYDFKLLRYSDEMIKYMHNGISRIIEDALKNPNAKIADFEIIGEAEKLFLQKLENVAGVSDNADKTVVDLFLEQVKKHPQKTAIVANDQTLSYEKLDFLSNSVANYLIKKGIKNDDIVVIMLPRDSRVLTSMLGILKSGGAFLCVSSELPEDRANYIIKDSGAKCVITSEIYAEALSESEHFTEIDIKTNNLCYAIYTSGTTGKPKGVLVEHKCLIASASPQNSKMVSDMVQVGKNTIAITSLSFDVSLVELFYSLLNGITSVMATHSDIENINLLAEKMQDNDVNVIITTPSRLMIYLDDADFYNAMKNIDFVMVAGEAFIPALYCKIKSASPDCKIYNCYGPSETFVTTSAEAISENVNLGIGIKGYTIHILDKYQKRLPFGRVGELCIGGVGVGRGYKNLPDETAKKYINLDGQRLYRSGDLARYNEKGELLYFGRIDNQVKIRGFRVELSEIEYAISLFEGINTCAVIMKNNYLCAFYTFDSEVAVSELKLFLGSILPHYMIPDAFVPIEKLPTTLNGKIDTNALKSIEVSFQKSSAPPTNTVQKTLCRIFENVLNISDVGIDDNFFEIGGNSLLAAKVIIDAKSEGFDFAYDDIFKKPTIKQLARNETVIQNISHFDYSVFDDILKWKTENVHKKRYRNVLVTGATGFLGLHIVKELLQNTDCKIYTLVRGKKNLTPEKRLNGLLFYYFSESYNKYFGERIFVVSGDVINEEIFNNPISETFDAIINCAADVSHFTYGDKMERINVDGVVNLIKLAKSQNARLVQISTPGIGMFGIFGQTQEKEFLSETDFYFGQDLSNDYIRTKFMAEREILLAAADGLNASIMRVGNLQGRFEDGEFQINQNSNAFINTLKVYAKLGFAPSGVAKSMTDYSPIDSTAKAIVNLLMSDSTQAIYHVFNNHKTSYSLIFECLNELGYTINCVPDDQYENEIKHILSDEEKRNVLTGIVDFMTRDDNTFEIQYECLKTAPLLEKLGMQWQNIDKDYIKKCLTAVIELGAFD